MKTLIPVRKKATSIFYGLSAQMGGFARETILVVAYRDQPEPSILLFKGKTKS